MVLVAVGTREATMEVLSLVVLPLWCICLLLQCRAEGSLGHLQIALADLRQRCKGKKESPLPRVTLGLTCLV